ncbi:MAG: class I SAM-dependent methyltransferase, partial [Tepidiformaceae bacterium]
MDHADHVNLLRSGVREASGAWADFGAGAGAFTLALADLLGPAGEIHAIDRDERALRRNERAMRGQFPGTAVHYVVADFTRPLELANLAGIVLANSLHFQGDQAAVVGLLRGYLAPQGRL